MFLKSYIYNHYHIIIIIIMTWTCLVTGVHFWRGTLKHSSRSTCRGTFRHSSRATSDIHSYHHRYHDDNYLIALLPRDIPGNVVALLPLLLPTHLTSQVIIPVTIVIIVFTTMIIHVVLFKLKFFMTCFGTSLAFCSHTLNRFLQSELLT